ncbi:MAG: glycosyltransferase family 2 protein [Panacagrimonas sp.]|jgi:glycosyltransferase involved in cell wall biosynthesis|nr:glycosyltransferase family 2 protein [Panacagrimonas sp.]MCC2658643.1 glycosyltransferase family 2 protein [Panacagrimonas sp.]
MKPLVSILTPVYNNAEYLAECIESVRAQTYGNWEYVIVNNCSTDGTLEIARRYAAMDDRIRVHDNDTFLGAEANHNHAMRQISARSTYCKLVFADDWLFPRCVEDMVAVAEQHPSAAIVGCYGLDGSRILWDGLPYPATLTSGREACRLFFQKRIYAFGTGTSLLYRSDIVRARDPFFDEANTHADTESCIELMHDHDFGFVHQVLVFSRQQPGSLREASQRMNTLLAARLVELARHGPHFLDPAELRRCIDERLDEYYNFLAVSTIRGNRDPKFWRHHRAALDASGHPLSTLRLLRAIGARVLRAVLDPLETFQKLGILGGGTRRW